MNSSLAVLSLVMFIICAQAQGSDWPQPPPTKHHPQPPPDNCDEPNMPPGPPHKKSPPPPPPPHKKSPPPPPPQKKSPPPPPPQKKSPPPPPPQKKSPPPPPPQKKSPPPPPPQKKSPPPPPPQKKSPPPPTPYKKSPPPPPPQTDYEVLDSLTPSNQTVVRCETPGHCFKTILTCPEECPRRKPHRIKSQGHKHFKQPKGCLIDCQKCETTCRNRKPHCHGYGSLCYDPRFVGGDGVMFYFHGQKGGNFAVVSDDKLQINAHFIGSRPQGRTRDYTWVQALSVMFDTHTLVLAAKRVSQWDDNVDSLLVKWDGDQINIPTDGVDEDTEWRVDSDGREVVVERTDEFNSIRVRVAGLVEMDIKVVPIGEEENRIHNYQLPADDAFAHLETQFKFIDLSDDVEGILGKTYQPGYVSPAKKGVFMPMIGGEDKYQTSSLDSPDCKACLFQRPSEFLVSEFSPSEFASSEFASVM
ncbi:hypothetical protein Vadar_033383 [Vaccinium darrowii]|uniref:Uncharacterized protein n=1 Tax=Vaccinium darrowii TaxID=229202 RepID=A0ACB7XE04_9ERIC|nr:hypothetical protein Vadar_033383 [Vaccinium darrowii]